MRRRVRPDGRPRPPLAAVATCDNGYKAIREFLRWAAALDPPPQAPDDITPAVQAQWRLSRPGTVYGRACQLAVRQWLPQVPGIPAAAIAASARRIPAGPARSETAYAREEFGQIKAVRVFNDRGRFIAQARVTDEIAAGVVMAPMGAWRKDARGHSTVNAVNPFAFATSAMPRHSPTPKSRSNRPGRRQANR